MCVCVHVCVCMCVFVCVCVCLCLFVFVRKTYRKNLLAIYNVHCPGNYFIYINLVDISLDDSACYDPKRESTK